MKDSVTRAAAANKRDIFVFIRSCVLRLAETYFGIVTIALPPPFAVLGAISSSVQAVKMKALETAIKRAKMIFFINLEV